MQKKSTIKKVEVVGIVFLTTILTFFLVMMILNFTIKTVSWKIADTYIDEEILDIYSSDNIANLVYDICDSQETEYDKVVCVNRIFKKYFIFEYHDDSNIRSPSKTLVEGGVCRDAAFFYCTIFNKMGLKCSMPRDNLHMFNIVYGENFYCRVDQKFLDCWNLGSKVGFDV